MDAEPASSGLGGFQSEEAMFLHFHRALGWTHPDVARAAKAEAEAKEEEEAKEAEAEAEA